jgi:tellurite resistance protein
VPGRLQHFPVTLFSTVLGTGGYVLATEKIFATYGLGTVVPLILLGLTSILYAVLLVLYAVKAVRWWPEVVAEINHPTKLNFFPAIAISLLILSAAFLEISFATSAVLWWVGAALQLAGTLAVLSFWIRRSHLQIQHFSPAWFIPVVGTMMVPIAGVAHAPADISWFFFAVGLGFGIMLLTIFLYRLIFHQPLPQNLIPTLFIVIAPPAVGTVAYVKLAGTFDSFARLMYFFAVFLFLLLLVHLTVFRRLRFFVSWWAYSFPLAALTLATNLVWQRTGEQVYKLAAGALWIGLTALVTLLVVRTVVALAHNEICVPEPSAPPYVDDARAAPAAAADQGTAGRS